MNEKMKVAVMNAIGQVDMEERNVPEPGDNEALIELKYVGVCGSDLHYFEKGAIGSFIVTPPFVLGHEASGVVVKVGKDVKDISVGDSVALEPGKTCGVCEFCKTGRYNLCPDVVFFATPPVDGVFCEYVAHPADLCFKLPENVSMLEGAMIEPLAVGFHAAMQADAHVGQTAVVFGAGCIGIVSMLALKAMNVSKVYIVDILDKRLAMAKTLGADETIKGDSDVTKTIMALTDGKGIDIVIDTVSAESTIKQSIDFVKKGGTITYVGYCGKDSVPIPMDIAINKELSLKTIFRYRNVYPMAIDAVANGKINLKDIVTNIYDFQDIQRALVECTTKKDTIVKAAIKI